MQIEIRVLILSLYFHYHQINLKASLNRNYEICFVVMELQSSGEPLMIEVITDHILH